MANTDQQLDQLKQKYAGVLRTIEQQGVRLSHVHVQDNKLFIQGTAPSQDAKNRVWDQIKQVNPNWASDLTADIDVAAGAGQQQQSADRPQYASATAGGGTSRTYTVQAGDSLSKISRQFYGDANQYDRIFEANRDKLSDPNKIRPGQVLNIPD